LAPLSFNSCSIPNKRSTIVRLIFLQAKAISLAQAILVILKVSAK
jgi:hypothetical protein